MTFAGGGCLAVIVILLLVGGLVKVLSGSDFVTSPAPSLPAATTSPPPPVYSESRLSDVPTTPVPVTPAPSLSPVQEAEREAVRQYPQLGIAGSALNQEFLKRFNTYKRTDPDYFNDPSWPLKLAGESFESVSPKTSP